MDTVSSTSDLYQALERVSTRVQKTKSTVLFHRGEEAFGIFVVFSGTVILDFGIDAGLGTICGPGALVGLPATLSRTKYRATATVGEYSELGFMLADQLFDLMQAQPEMCKQILHIMSAKVSQVYEVQKDLLDKARSPSQAKYPLM